MRILVVDDDDDSAALLACLFHRQGWEVDTSHSAEGARRALRDVEYNVLVTDLYLPDGLGTDLLEPSPPPNLRTAILLTGALDEPQRRRSEALGFHKCLAKPLNAPDLIEAIRSRIVARSEGTA